MQQAGQISDQSEWLCSFYKNKSSIFIVMDQLSATSFKSLQADFYSIVKLTATNGCLEGREMVWKMSNSKP